MSLSVNVHGMLQSDGTLKLDQPSNLPPGPVVVTVQPASIGAPPAFGQEGAPVPEVSNEFYAELARLPVTEVAYEAQRAIFRQWRTDPRFEVYWALLDQALTRSFEHVREWAEARDALADLEGYDFDAYKRQREYDRLHTGDHLL